MAPDRVRLIVALLCLGVFGAMMAAVWRESGQDWQWYQKEFARRTAADLPGRLVRIGDPEERRRSAEAAARVAGDEVGLRQFYVPALGEVSRCITCHVALTEPLVAREEFPFKRHPEPYLEPRWHAIEQFGCVVCHGGEGRATTADDAHGVEGRGAAPRRKDEYAQAACGRCHQARPAIEGAPAWNLGRWLVADRGCAGCHDLGTDLAAGRVGRALVGLGSRTSEEWLAAWLRDPSAVRSDARMPRPALGAAEAQAVVRALVRGRDERIDALGGQVERLSPALARRGRSLAQGDAACATCHDFPQVQREGTYPVPGRRFLGPSLAGAGDKLSAGAVAALLTDPRQVVAGSGMPQYSLPTADRDALVAFVMSLRSPAAGRAGRPGSGPGRAPAPEESRGEAGPAALAAMRRHGCAACHDVPGLSDEPRIGPGLADVGDRRAWELDWGPLDVPVDERHLVGYLLRKLERPGQFREAPAGAANPLRMPTFRLAPSERRCVVTYLLSRSARQLPEQYIVPDPSPPPREPDGRFASLNDRYRCTSCHALKGQGGSIAPALDGAGSKLRGDWLRRHLAAPERIRPPIQARMPHMGLPAAEVEAIALYLEQLADDRVLAGGAVVSAPGAAEASDGLGLFLRGAGPERAPFGACIACHRHGGEKGGVAGPDLTGAGRRLHAEWIHAWLRLGHRLVPGTRMPTMGLESEDARRLTAFVLSDVPARSSPPGAAAPASSAEDGLASASPPGASGGQEGGVP